MFRFFLLFVCFAVVNAGFTCTMCDKLVPFLKDHECKKHCDSLWTWLQGACEDICEKLISYSPSTACELAGYCSFKASMAAEATAPLCVQQKAFATEAASDAFVPQCENNGAYATKQCWSKFKECWCVDKHTGEAIDGTRVQGDIASCDF
eukprot:TRINITY_DN67564_c12_g6_i1.p1 TRINITY_DN67564_c12_g6~~TRINITY_DN67564_c12_g6_i1.p1  ORF type:complete len:150 (-),score=20.50 TRINITY_DN67564_c12_g6_i1:112-561(-)